MRTIPLIPVEYTTEALKFIVFKEHYWGALGAGAIQVYGGDGMWHGLASWQCSVQPAGLGQIAYYLAMTPGRRYAIAGSGSGT